MKLRPYQQDALDAIIESFKKQQKYTLIQLPTGAGKSAIIANLVAWANKEHGAKCLVLAHQKELVEQMAENLNKWGVVEFGVYCASVGGRKEVGDITVGSRQSVALGGEFEPNLVVIDECHLWSKQYEEIIGRFGPRCRVLGVTATPFKTGKGYLWECTPFPEPCYKLSMQQLIDMGFLCQYKYMATGEKVEVKSENDLDALYNEMKKPRHMESVRNAIEKYAIGRKWIVVYAVNIEHAEDLGKMLGCPVVHSRNDYKLSDWRGGIIVNVGMMTTGIDIPAIDCLIMARPTLSPALYVQICGRGLRLKNGGDCLILDMVGNWIRHGDIANPDITKSEPERERKEKEREARICLDCFEINEHDADVCAFCGVDMRKLKDWREENARYEMKQIQLKPQPVRIQTVDVREEKCPYSNRKGKKVHIRTWCGKHIWHFFADKFGYKGYKSGDTVYIRKQKKRWKICETH